MVKAQARARRRRLGRLAICVPARMGQGRGGLLAGTALAALISCGLFSFSTPVRAQVTGVSGGVVVGGQATIANAAPGHLTVTQSTQRGVIDWRSFSIGAGERVDFLQPGTNSVTLNRVTGPDPSVIAGRLTATGQLILVNGAGVVFANGAQINAAGLVASTAGIADPRRFMQGGTVVFDQPSADPNAAVVNAGTITVRDGGLVGLVGNTASNSGVINARLGRVTIGGAETFMVDLAGDGLINFQLGSPVSRQPVDPQGNKRPLASNTGTINADGGTVTLTARAARGVVDNVVNAGGVINARAVREEGGVVVFGADDGGTVNVTGTVDVSGAGAQQRGGQVVATAANGRVNVASTTRIDASGARGGGTVLVGGGKQGQGPVAAARDTTVAPGATILADATGKGGGGSIIVWADNATVFGGLASAKGGPQGGDGGFIETSGRSAITILPSASINAAAVAGNPGTWLLDPTNLTIDATLAGQIVTQLESGTNVTIQTDSAGSDAGNITLGANISTSDIDSNVTLTLMAHGKIDLGSKTISLTSITGNTPGLTLDTATLGGAAADHSITGSGPITVTTLTLNSAIAGGSVSLTGTVVAAVLNFTSNGAVTITDNKNDIFSLATTASTAGGAVTIVSTEATVVQGGGINAGANPISITTTGNGDTLAISGPLTGSTITLSSADALSGGGSITASGAVSLKAANGGSIDLSGKIAGMGLVVEADSGGVTLSNVNNAFGSFSTIGTIGGSVSVFHNGALTVNATDVGNNSASFSASNSTLTLAGALTANAGVGLTATGTVTIDAPINASGATVGVSGGAVTQTAAGVITAANLLATSTTGDIDLTRAINVLTMFAASAATGSIGLRESDGFVIGQVAGTLGITATTANVQLSAGGSITQTEGVTAAGLAVTATGLVDLTSNTTNTNAVAVFAANITGAGVGLRESDGFSVGSVAKVGALLALDGVTTTGAGNAVSLKAGGSITQTKAISAAGGLAAVTTSGDINFGTVDNATNAVALTSTGNVSYRTASGMTVTEVAKVGSLASVVGINATAGTTTLVANASTAIAQDKAIDTATLDISTSGSGNVTLTHGSNLVGTLQSTGGLGSGTIQVLDSAGGLNVGAMTAGGAVTVTTSGGALVVTGTLSTSAAGKDISLIATGAVTVNAAVNAGTGTVALRSGGTGSITATGGAITAAVLTLQSDTGGGADVQTAAHDVGTVQTAGSGLGSGGLVFKQSRAGGLTVGAVVSRGTVTINEGTGALATSGTIDTSSGNANVTLGASAGTLAINGQIKAGGGQVALLAQQSITQANTGAGITADSLRAVNSTGDITLSPTGVSAADVNAVNTFAASAGGGNVSYTSTSTFDVGTVNTTKGITTLATKGVTLTVLQSGKTITQSAGTAGAITTGTINITTNNGNVTIDNGTNSITAIGTVSLGSGAFTFVNNAGTNLNVGGNVVANGGIDVTNKGDLTTTAGITSDGAIALRSTTGQVVLGGAVTSNTQSITLHSSSALNTGAGLISAATAGSGDVTLISDTGTVTIGAGGVTVGDTLTIQIGAGQLLTISGAITAPSVALVADQMSIAAAINATNTISLAPVTAGTTVTIGTSGAPTGLVIDSAGLANLASAATVTIGKNALGATTAGTIRIGTATIAATTLNLFTNAGIVQDGVLNIGSGVGALSITAAGAVSLASFGVVIGSVGGTTTAGSFSILRTGGATATLTVKAITTAGDDIAVRNFDGDITVSGAATSGGGNILFGANDGVSAVLNVNAAVDAGAGSVGLFGFGGIAQNASGTITAANLVGYIVNGPGSVTLTAANAVTGNVTLTAVNGNVSFTDTSGFTVFGATSITVAGVNFTVVGSGAGIRTVAGGTTSLTAGGDVVQAGGAGSLISTGTLNVARRAGSNPSFTLDNANNAVAIVGSVAIGKGSFTLSDGTGVSVAGNGQAGGGYTVAAAGTVTLGFGSTIDTSAATSGAAVDGNVSLTATAGGSVALNGNVNAGPGGVLTLSAGGSLTQSAIATIAAARVDAVASGSVSLTSLTNAFSMITGSGAAGFSAATAQALTVGIGGVSSTSGAVTLTTTGAASDIVVGNGIVASLGVTLTAGRDITLNGSVTSTSGTVALFAGRDIAGSVNGGVVAASLRAETTGGSVDLSGGAAINNVATIAGSASGSFSYVDGNTAALTIGTVTTVGIASAGGSITVKATAGTLTVNNPVTASAAGSTVTLESQGNLGLVAAVTGNTANGRVTLASAAGSIIEFGGGVVTAAELLATAATNVDLAQLNAVGAKGFAATAGTGFVAFINNGAIELDQVGGISGVTAGGAVVIANSSGSITQTTSGIISAGGGLLLQSLSGSIVLDQQNKITGNFAVVGTTAGDITIRNTGAINIGTVGPVATVGGIAAFSGITGGVGRILTLASINGAITQSGGAGDRVIAGELRVQTNSQNVTLSNTGNQFDSVGNSNLVSGTLTVFDAVGGLTLSSPVIADGGVILTTQGAFTLPGSIVVANGDISLTSLTGSISLGSTLSAANGQVQLDAAGTIAQTAGTIAARRLIVRSSGGVDLTQPGNDVATIAGSSGAGAFFYRDASAIAIGTLVSSTGQFVSGLTTTNQNVTIAGGAGGIAINAPVSAGTGTVRLQSSQGDIVQGAGSPITATTLLANAIDGSVDFGGSTNTVTNIAGSALGSTFALISSSSITVTVVAGDGITAGAAGIVANNGDITLVSGGAITLNGIVNAANGAPTGGAGTGNVTLLANGGGISQAGGAAIVGNDLLAVASGSIDLPEAANFVVRLAGTSATGTFRYRNAGALVIDAVGGTSGVVTNNQDIGIHAAGDLTLNQSVNALGASDVSTAVVRLQASNGNLTEAGAGVVRGGVLLVNALGSGSVILTNPSNLVLNSGVAGAPGFVAGVAGGNFRFVNGNALTVSGVGVAGDAGLGIIGATGVAAGNGRLVDLGVAAGNLNIQGPVSADAGMILYRRVAGGQAGNITIGGDSGNAGNGTGGAYLLIADLTGSSSLALTGLPESGPGSLAPPTGLFTTPTPPTTATPAGLGSGTSLTGILTVGALQGINTVVYLSGGSGSSITSTAPGQFGILGVYAPEGAQVNLLSIVRAIINTSIRPIGPFGPNDPPAVSGPPDVVARDYVRKGGLPSLSQRFNNCVIAGPSCTTIFTQVANPPAASDDAFLGIAGSSLDDSSIILVNQGNEEFIEDDDERRRRAAGRR